MCLAFSINLSTHSSLNALHVLAFPQKTPRHPTAPLWKSQEGKALGVRSFWKSLIYANAYAKVGDSGWAPVHLCKPHQFSIDTKKSSITRRHWEMENGNCWSSHSNCRCKEGIKFVRELEKKKLDL